MPNPKPSQILRDAAQRIRDLADAATPSGALPHGWSGAVGYDNSPMLFGGPTQDGYRTGIIFHFQEETLCGDCTRPTAGDVAHMAAWHPDVAVEVAAFLEQAAKSADYTLGAPPPFTAIALRIAAMFPPVDEPAAVVVVAA
ncbi:hypothetical protein [Micromonospora sp. NPDC049891]|uniref:hypothetical protein n=1 Tax=Micromonospora sp. NPDC049891 TaxID=3155655 RepID=UPI0033FE9250